ncbi:Chitobiase/beta-hexosaminidase C-terminal domain-containing protein [Prevotellaceae bacterium HUN156]|nr:Chitobiase/beta-hexosaminidase C-terminal domain-containing protein [Prevotellaceae bacterium HUN156]
MKKLFLKAMLLLCALIVGSSSLWADDYVLYSGTITEGDYVIYYDGGALKNTVTSNRWDYTTVTPTSGKISNPDASIVWHIAASGDYWTLYNEAISKYAVGTAKNQGGVSATLDNKAKWTVTGTTTYDFENLDRNNSSSSPNNKWLRRNGTYGFACYASGTGGALSLYKKTASVGTTAAPSISGTTPFFNSTTVTITNDATADGASIYYTLDGSDPTTTTSATCFEYTAPFEISATTTVKAIAKKATDTNASSVVEKTFTKITPLNGIAALNAAEDGTYYVTFTNAQFTYIKNSAGFLNEANAGIYYYNSTTKPVLKKTFNGLYQVVKGTHEAMPQITSIEEVTGESTTTTADEIQAPTVMTADELDANFSANLARQIQINDYVVTNSSKLTDAISFNNSYSSTNLTEGATYKLVGYPYMSTTYKQFRVVSALIKPSTPTFDPVEGEFSEAFTLHLACATTGSTMYYTTDGTTPTTESTEYNSTNGIAIPAATTTIKVIAVKAGMVSDVASATYTYNSIAKPLFTPADGSQLYYGETVAITCATDGTTIYYTTDGTEPTASSNEYSAPIAITANTVTLKAFAKKGTEESSIATATFTLKAPAAPTFSVAAGAVARNTVVTISSADNTTIMYTTDGTDADKGTDANSNSVNVTITDGMTIKAIAYDPELNISTEASATYTIAQAVAPTFSVAEGSVIAGSTVALATTTEGATIYYTTDGTTPDENSTAYTAPIVINADMTIKAIAVKENYVNSEVSTAAYTVIAPIKGFDIDFETSDLSCYVEWDFENVAIRSGVTGVSAHGGSKWGGNVNTNGNGTPTCSIKTKNKVAYPGSLEFYISKESGNNSTSSWIVAVSSNGSDWTQVGDAQDAKGMSKGAWTKVTRDLSSHHDVFVRISYGSSSAIRAIDDISLQVNDKATVTDAKYATFCSTHDLDFSATGIKVYKAASDGTKVNLTEIEDGIVPANTGVVLFSETAQSNVAIPVTTADATADFSDNELIGINAKTKVAEAGANGKTNYILSNETAGVGFYKAAAAGANLAAHKAYLSTSASATSRDFLGFEDDVTGINEVKGQKNVVEGVYDLQGRKVVTPSKGLYIVNGKKVVIK